MSSSKKCPFTWDPIENFHQNEGQPEQSYNEQKLAIRLMKEAADEYLSFGNTFVKCTGIRDAAGSGKTWTMEYGIIYPLFQGLTIITTSHMAQRAIQLGGKHLAYLLGIPYGKANLTPQRCAELALHRIMRKHVIYNFLQILDVLVIDELAQSS